MPWVTRRVVVAPGASLQARAREARHRALVEVAGEVAAGRAPVEGIEGDLGAEVGGAGATLVATAHHAEDRAETFLLRLARGAGVNGLGVMPVREGHLVRPLLRASKRDIMTHIHRHGVPFATDPSNTNRRFSRVRVREEILPALVALDPRFVEHVTNVCDELHALKTRLEAPPLTVALGRRARELVERLGPDAPRKMAVKLPKGRVATYDREVAEVVIRTPSSEAHSPSGQPKTRRPTRKDP